MLMVSEVENWVARIEAMAADDEGAHSEEDKLHLAVLQAIADGHPYPRRIAAEALMTVEIEFSRWCA